MTIDLTKPNGSRLTSLKVRTNCDGPSNNEKYEELNDENLYSITTMSFLASGKDGYDILKTAKVNYTIGRYTFYFFYFILLYCQIIEIFL